MLQICLADELVSVWDFLLSFSEPFCKVSGANRTEEMLEELTRFFPQCYQQKITKACSSEADSWSGWGKNGVLLEETVTDGR